MFWSLKHASSSGEEENEESNRRNIPNFSFFCSSDDASMAEIPRSPEAQMSKHIDLGGGCFIGRTA